MNLRNDQEVKLTGFGHRLDVEEKGSEGPMIIYLQISGRVMSGWWYHSMG